MSIYSIILGDWGGDGHAMITPVYVSTNLDKECISEYIEVAEEISGTNLSGHFEDYGVDYLEEDQYKINKKFLLDKVEKRKKPWKGSEEKYYLKYEYNDPESLFYSYLDFLIKEVPPNSVKDRLGGNSLNIEDAIIKCNPLEKCRTGISWYGLYIVN